MLKHVFETSKLIFFKFPKNIKTKLKQKAEKNNHSSPFKDNTVSEHELIDILPTSQSLFFVKHKAAATGTLLFA